MPSKHLGLVFSQQATEQLPFSRSNLMSVLAYYLNSLKMLNASKYTGLKLICSVVNLWLNISEKEAMFIDTCQSYQERQIIKIVFHLWKVAKEKHDASEFPDVRNKTTGRKTWNIFRGKHIQ